MRNTQPAKDSPTFADAYTRIMDMIRKHCLDTYSKQIMVDLTTVRDKQHLEMQFNLIEIAEAEEKPLVTTGHSHNHAVSPPIIVCYNTIYQL